jgi:hypothetical protein
MRHEYETVAKAGIPLQIDCPSGSSGVDGVTFEQIEEQSLEACRSALVSSQNQLSSEPDLLPPAPGVSQKGRLLPNKAPFPFLGHRGGSVGRFRTLTQ